MLQDTATYGLCGKQKVLAAQSSVCYNVPTKAGGDSRADAVVFRLRRYGRYRNFGIRLRLVFTHQANGKPQMPEAPRDAPQEDVPKAKGAVQVRRVGSGIGCR